MMAPMLSPARSTPKARPYALRGATVVKMRSLAGPRMPREAHANARSPATCHTAVVAPIAAVATAVPR